MRLTLVNPPYTFWRDGAEPIAALLGRHLPLGLLFLAAYVRQRVPGLVVRILDAPAQGLTCEETARRAIASAPDLVGITMTTTVSRNAQAIATAVKASLPSVPIVVGGPHVSGVGPAVLESSRAFDLAVVGEGEETFRELLAALGDGLATTALPGIRGIVFRDPHGRVKLTEPRPPIADLDALPFPAFDLLEGFPRAYPSNAFFSPNGPTGTLVTSRGCLFQCTFCDQSTFGHQFRAASPEAVLGAVQRLQREHGVRYVVFSDDTFTLDRGRVLGICELLARLRPRVLWSCHANAATVDPELLGAMRRAGCWSISYGLESGSPRILKALRKNFTVERAAQAVRATRAAGIRVKGLFILGTPEESRGTVDEMRAFMRSLPLTTINLSKFTPFPGSELRGPTQGGLLDAPERLNGMNFVVPSKHLSIDELEREYTRTIRSFYHRPRTVLTHLGLMLGHWGNARRLLAAAPRLARARRQYAAEKTPAVSCAKLRQGR